VERKSTGHKGPALRIVSNDFRTTANSGRVQVCYGAASVAASCRGSSTVMPNF
jgi:hypothetical protein